MVAALARNLKLRGRALQEAAERLFTQADKGSLVPRELAPILPRATAAMAATGRTGPGAAAEMGAMLQMFFRATGSAEMTVTAFERFIDTVMSEKAEFLRASGIDPLEPGTRNLRALPAIMDDVLRAAEHTAQKRGVSLGEVLTDVFDVQARRGVQAVAAAPEDLQGFLTMHEPGILARKSRDLALGPGAQMKGVGALLNESIEHAAGPALREAGEFAGRARQQGFRSALEREVAEIEAQHRARGVDTPVSRVPQSVLDAEAAQAGVPRGRLQVDIDVRAEPGLQATPRVRQVPEGIDVDTGPYMPTP
jgi:hypothetical protein